MTSEVTEPLSRFAQAFDGARPEWFELRDTVHHRWVRLHSLPGSKRYAEDDAERAVVLARHHAVLDALAGGPDAPVLVVTPVAPGHRPTYPGPGVAPATAWGEIVIDPDEPACALALESRPSCSGTELDPLLLDVADDLVKGVLVLDPGLAWAYAPYDGGGDAIARTPEERDVLRARFAGWLSPHPSGL